MGVRWVLGGSGGIKLREITSATLSISMILAANYAIYIVAWSWGGYWLGAWHHI
jgi:hypothetical protein